MNLNLLKNKLSLVLVLLGIGAFSAFSQNDSTKIVVVEDVYVNETDPTTNFDGITDMHVSKDDANGNTRETYLKFDISALSGKGGLVSVDLSIMGATKTDDVWTTGPDFYIDVYGCSSDWTEKTLTWDNKIASYPDVIANADIQNGRYALNGTEADKTLIMKYIVDAMDKHLQFVSFVIKGQDETPGARIWISSNAWEPAKLIVVQDISLDEPGAVKIFAESLTIAGTDNVSAITVDNGTLQMDVTILPVDADYHRALWSVADGTGKATINSSTGLLTALKNGTVTVTADAIDGSWLRATEEITLSNQDYSYDERNIILNGTFSTDLAWIGDRTIVDGVCQITSTVVHANPWDASLNQLMAVPYDKRALDYIFSFKVWSTETRSLNVDMQDNNNEYKRYGISTDALSIGGSDWTFNINTTPTVYNFHVNFADMAVNCTQTLQFNIGLSVATVYLDSVSLMTVEDFALKANQLNANTIKIYPNPVGAENELTVSLVKENVKVAIYNTLGQKLMEKVANGNLVKFDVGNLRKGMYIVKLSDGTSQKFIR